MNIGALNPYATEMPFMSKVGGTARLLRYLSSFLVLAEEESFAIAAKKLHLSQPALSRRIKSLEEEIGFELFERLPRGVRVSAAGKSLLADCRHMLETIERACRKASRAARQSGPTLRVGLTDIAMRTPLVTEALHRLNQLHPDIEILHISLPTESQLASIEVQDIDLAFVHFPFEDLDMPGPVRRIMLDEDYFVVAMADNHPLAAVPELRLTDLRDETFVWPARFSGRKYGELMMAACEAVEISPRISAYAMTADQVMWFVVNGTGIGFVPARMSSMHRIPGLTLRDLVDMDVRFTLEVAWREDADIPYLGDFIDIVTELADRKP